MLLPLLFLAGTAAPPPPLFPFALTQQRYRIELSIRSEVDLSALGMPAQVQEQGAVGFVTVTLTDSAGGRALLALVDSATFDAGDLPSPSDAAEQARGATLRGRVDRAGKVYDLTASSDNPLVGMFQSVFGDFFPRTPVGKGGRWTDTLNLTSHISGGDTRSVVITEFSAGGVEEFRGMSANKILTSFTTTMEGTVPTPGGEAAMKGSGSGTGNYYIDAAGAFLGGSRTTSQVSVVTMAMAPAPIPVRTTTVLVVTPLS